MARIESDQQEIRGHLEKLVSLFEEVGGFINEAVTIVCQDGGLSVHAHPDLPRGDRLVSIPTKYLVPTASYGLRLEGNDICMKTPGNEVDRNQVKLMEQILAIFNLCGKIEFHRANAPSRLYIEVPDACERIFFPKQLNALSKLPKEDFYLHDFLHSRVFVARQQDESPDAIDSKGEVIMPIIDYLNHHQSAGGFQLNAGALVIDRYSLQSGSNECFVRYSRIDAQIAFAVYGFVDTEATSVLSCPIRVKVPGIRTINIDRQPGLKRKHEVPNGLADLRQLVPPMGVSSDERELNVKYLVIPGEHQPRAMRRIIRAFIYGSEKIKDPDQLQELTLEVERQIISGNIAHYEGILSYVDSVDVSDDLQPILEDAKRMARHQLSLLESYKERVAALSAA